MKLSCCTVVSLVLDFTKIEEYTIIISVASSVISVGECPSLRIENNRFGYFTWRFWTD